MSKMNKRKAPVSFVIAIVLAFCSVIGVLAYLSVNSGPVKNTFTPATDTDPSIDETFKDNVKTGVSVDVGDPGYAVYVRAAIVVTWKSSTSGSNEVLADKPVLGTDYSIDLNTTDWFKKGEFYYHIDPVNSGNTEVLINSAKPLRNAPEDGYVLSVEIVSQTIQALGATDDGDIPAATAAWGVTVGNDGKLTN